MDKNTDHNPAELPLSIRLLDGWIEQVDRFGPELVKGAQDYKCASMLAINFTRKTVVSAVERTGMKQPFLHTMTDALQGVCSVVLAFECMAIEALVKAERKAALVARDTLCGSGKS